MRRFIITSNKFNGQAEIFYNEKEVLNKIDCSDTDMTEETISHFKRATPATIKQLFSGGNFGEGTVVIEGDLDVTFEIFYKRYPLKRNKYRAEKAWEKVSKSDRVKAFYSLPAYEKYLSRESWQTPMLADRYLTEREFETEWNKVLNNKQ